MNQRIATGVVFGVVMLALLLLSKPYALSILILLLAIACIASTELVDAFKNNGISLSRTSMLIGIFWFLSPLLLLKTFDPRPESRIFLLDLMKAGTLYALPLLMWLFLSSIILLLRRGVNYLVDALITQSMTIYVGFPLASAVILRFFVPQGWYWLSIGLLSPWVSDTFAFFAGSFLGKKKIVPMISPKKTWAGFFGGIAGTILVLALLFIFVLRNESVMLQSSYTWMLAAVVFGTVLSVASQLGDWFASAVKRWCNVKDFGSFLPGHGGLVDRFDSVFFTMPLTLLLAWAYQLR